MSFNKRLYISRIMTNKLNSKQFTMNIYMGSFSKMYPNMEFSNWPLNLRVTDKCTLYTKNIMKYTLWQPSYILYICLLDSAHVVCFLSYHLCLISVSYISKWIWLSFGSIRDPEKWFRTLQSGMWTLSNLYWHCFRNIIVSISSPDIHLTSILT